MTCSKLKCTFTGVFQKVGEKLQQGSGEPGGHYEWLVELNSLDKGKLSLKRKEIKTRTAIDPGFCYRMQWKTPPAAQHEFEKRRSSASENEASKIPSHVFNFESFTALVRLKSKMTGVKVKMLVRRWPGALCHSHNQSCRMLDIQVHTTEDAGDGFFGISRL